MLKGLDLKSCFSCSGFPNPEQEKNGFNSNLWRRAWSHSASQKLHFVFSSWIKWNENEIYTDAAAAFASTSFSVSVISMLKNCEINFWDGCRAEGVPFGVSTPKVSSLTDKATLPKFSKKNKKKRPKKKNNPRNCSSALDVPAIDTTSTACYFSAALKQIFLISCSWKFGLFLVRGFTLICLSSKDACY